MNDNALTLFQHLWTKATGKPDYNKSEWMMLERVVERAVFGDPSQAGSVAADFAPFVSANDSPLQLPGRDRRVSIHTYGGPESRRDARVLFDVPQLRRLLDAARKSPTGRVVLGQAGVRVELYESPAGHRYEVWKLVSLREEPERPAFMDSGRPV